MIFRVGVPYGPGPEGIAVGWETRADRSVDGIGGWRLMFRVGVPDGPDPEGIAVGWETCDDRLVDGIGGWRACAREYVV
jgi:hypothetical protein